MAIDLVTTIEQWALKNVAKEDLSESNSAHRDTLCASIQHILIANDGWAPKGAYMLALLDKIYSHLVDEDTIELISNIIRGPPMGAHTTLLQQLRLTTHPMIQLHIDMAHEYRNVGLDTIEDDIVANVLAMASKIVRDLEATPIQCTLEAIRDAMWSANTSRHKDDASLFFFAQHDNSMHIATMSMVEA